MKQRPNAWTLGDRATVREGRFQTEVEIIGFTGQLVDVRYLSGREGRRPHGALSEIEPKTALLPDEDSRVMEKSWR